MHFTARRSAQMVATLLIATVVTQIFYVVLSDAGVDFSRTAVWATEAVAFTGISVFALVVLARGSAHPAAWAAIAVGGILNVVQVGMGLTMFGPLKEAGNALAPVFQAVVAGAFFLYFAGKFAFGFAALVIGMDTLRSGSVVAKAVGGLAALAGIAALLTNLGAMAQAADMTFIAGGAGTAATLMLALATWMRVGD